ncbi:ARM repeat-containing protein [Venustampulla echinocandica]|uniref:ARM repeat-containing protein n=1 Tax=Venustampulla echinocandica TaxID=2656787 RepID=A0A370TZ72_9HELO|nr:ARM repeat-containing protein [Venustampulla echinocandica]RDL40798.1 ARM repeat-containing protein [Venustampulla echinocandica]
MAEQEEDFSSLPLPDRFQHKIWKVRKAAYEDAAKQFEATPDENDPAFRPFLQDPGLWKGAVADSNVAAQQDGIAALCSFLKYGGRESCTRTRSYTLTPLVEKCLSSTRAATKASALEAILLYIELDTPGPILEDLLPALSNKQPKVIAATLAALTAIFHNYGCKTVDPKPVLKVLPKPFSHADKNVRAEATNLAVEFYRWLREAMKPMFWGDLKPTQQTEMEAQFDKIKSEPTPKQERFLRSQQAAMARAPPPGADGAEDENELDAEPEEIDVYDLAEPQDVLSKIAPDFHDRLGSSKWKERKDALEGLFGILNVPKIKDGDFNEIVRGLAKCMKDANIAVVTQAAQCIEVLAKGLRKPFGKYRSVLMSPIMERLKEKKASVSDALGAALDAVFIATSLSECLEETLESLKHKNPQVKEGTMKFLVRCLRTTREAPAKPEVASISEAAKKLLSESSEVLRSGGAEVLGTVMKIMGERAMGPYLEGLDEIRKTKIKEYFETAEVKAKDKPKPKPPPAAAQRAAPAGGTRKVATKKPATKKPAAAPSIYAQEAPLAPQPTSRSTPGTKLAAPKPSGLAAPGGLKAPLKRTLPGPGGAASTASPRRPVAQAPPPADDEPPAPPRLGLAGRGLAGRSLAKAPAAAAPPASSMSPPPASGLTAVERAELEELRLDKDRLLRQADDFRQERSRFNSEVQELKNQNAQLIEDHTRDVLSIKAKETQLVRARSDCEAAEAMCGQLRREMERLKRALTSAERVNSPTVGLPSPSRDAMGDEGGIYRDTGMYGAPHDNRAGMRARMSYTSTLSEEKENTGDAFAGQYGRSKLSPEPRNGRTSAASGSVGRNSPTPYTSARSGGQKSSTDSARDDGNGGVESWKRAAEVTSALKAKIEQMKARQGISRP